MLLAQGVLDNQLTLSITVEQLLAWIIIGLIAGLLASLFVRGRIGITGAIVIGLVGAIIGGFIFFDLLDIVVTGALARGIFIRWVDVLVAFVGAMIVLALTRSFYGRRL